MAGKGSNVVPFQIGEAKVDISQSTCSTDTLPRADQPKLADDWSAYRLTVTMFDMINHLLIIVVTVFLLYYALQAYSVTNLHAALCTVGYVLLMSEAILILAGGNLLTNRLSRRTKVHAHWILQAVGLICTVWGVVIIFRVKTVHFKSIHAITGFASTVAMCVLSLLGYPVFVAAKLRKYVRPVVIKFLHNFIGIACFAVGMASQITAYKKGWLPRVTNGVENVQVICIVLTSVITVLTLRGALASLCRQAVALFK